MKTSIKHQSFAAALIGCLALLAADLKCAQAATFNVTTANISGPGSLPVAIAQANATPGKNKINVTVSGVITLGLALPVVTNSVAIAGTASSPTVISGGGTLPLFTFAAGTTNSLSNLVLANGYTSGNGAAIINSSTLFVDHCVITNNRTTGGSYGGAIYNSGVVTISSSILFSNYTGSYGGAIYNSGTISLKNSQLFVNQASSGGAIYNDGNLVVLTSAVSNNIAAFGGGIFNNGTFTAMGSTFISNIATNTGLSEGGALFSRIGYAGITNSTFYQNSVICAVGGYGGNVGYGGAIFVDFSGNVSLVSCTIANNSAQGKAGCQGIGGGINNTNPVNNTVGIILLLNTIVAGNIVVNGSNPDLYGSFVSGGYNLIGNNQGATGLSIFDFQNVSANLGPLQDNGGGTLTCAPLPGSYAIGYGTSAGAPTTDQRGVPRPKNGAYDIGAVQTVTNTPYLMNNTFAKGAGFTMDSIFDSTNKYRIQVSTNLAVWADVYTNTSSGVLHFTDSTATNLPRRYYRTATP